MEADKFDLQNFDERDINNDAAIDIFLDNIDDEIVE